ncbi:hypothetical protein HUA74_13695 [Myxococcus sp. CA051A]|uniref:hypothetical protein n=1 Tax=unclassified Myxococcus TaxID=2648731 RepID=UPI00157B5C2C|nr:MULTISPECIES: hypothetical protein [unclassified Myxococcus]NTX36297.1 hypothetical protein [Myxococcus sp. CA033]NTX61711.1 hypothetical protein [Myxococcus sp. CA051A]
MGGWRLDDLGRRGLLVAVLLSGPALAGAPASASNAGLEAAEDPLSGGVVDGVEAPESGPPEGSEPLEPSQSSLTEGALAQALPPRIQPRDTGDAVSPVPPTSAQPTPEPAQQADPKKKKKSKPGAQQEDSLGEDSTALDDTPQEEVQTVRVFGRVYARASADERAKYQRALSIPSARVGVGTSLSNLEAEVSADLADSSILKDAFVRLADDSKRFRLYGGQFKAPFLQRRLEGSWSLPIQGRGLVEDYLGDVHELGGRRMGLMGEVRLKSLWDVRVSAGVFQGSKDDLGVRTKEDLAGRVSVRPFKKMLTLGVSTYVAEALDRARRHAVAADAELKLGGLNVTGEVVTGRLPMGPFTAQLLLASWTVPVTTEWALQPVVGAEGLQLRGDVEGRGHSLVGGLNLLLGSRFRGQFQVERALRPGDEAPGLEYSLQLATRF